MLGCLPIGVPIVLLKGARGGGGVSLLSAPHVSITRSLFEGNAAKVGPGGALSVIAAGQVTLQDVEITGNLVSEIAF
jgi:hypothetical protein